MGRSQLRVTCTRDTEASASPPRSAPSRVFPC